MVTVAVVKVMEVLGMVTGGSEGDRGIGNGDSGGNDDDSGSGNDEACLHSKQEIYVRNPSYIFPSALISPISSHQP
jgi:hypothetical protein